MPDPPPPPTPPGESPAFKRSLTPPLLLLHIDQHTLGWTDNDGNGGATSINTFDTLDTVTAEWVRENDKILKKIVWQRKK